MSYTTPPTFVAGDVLTAAQLNTLGADIVYVYGITQGLTFSGTKLTRTAATSIANTTDSTITWTAEPTDIGGWYSSGTDIIVPAGAIPAGYTTISAIVLMRALWASNGTGYRKFKLLVNGSAVIGPTTPAISGDTTEAFSMDFLVNLAAADTISLQLYQNSGGALNASNISLTVVRLFPVA